MKAVDLLELLNETIVDSHSSDFKLFPKGDVYFSRSNGTVTLESKTSSYTIAVQYEDSQSFGVSFIVPEKVVKKIVASGKDMMSFNVSGGNVEVSCGDYVETFPEKRAEIVGDYKTTKSTHAVSSKKMLQVGIKHAKDDGNDSLFVDEPRNVLQGMPLEIAKVMLKYAKDSIQFLRDDLVLLDIYGINKRHVYMQIL